MRGAAESVTAAAGSARAGTAAADSATPSANSTNRTDSRFIRGVIIRAPDGRERDLRERTDRLPGGVCEPAGPDEDDGCLDVRAELPIGVEVSDRRSNLVSRSPHAPTRPEPRAKIEGLGG